MNFYVNYEVLICHERMYVPSHVSHDTILNGKE